MARDDAFKQSCLYDTRCYVPKATTPCAIAYDYARIRRLVRPRCGFYRGSVAEKQRSGLVARFHTWRKTSPYADAFRRLS